MSCFINCFKGDGPASNGIVEGLNGMSKVTARKSYGFITYWAMEVTLYHGLGDLPLPDYVPKFC